MKKPTTRKPLALDTQTLRTLADAALVGAAGGAMANNTFGLYCYSKKSECWGC